jgi:type 1 fimbriae regulatory protein FimE
MRGNKRQYFTESELARLISAARKGRYGHRDATLILLMARHGLRVRAIFSARFVNPADDARRRS